MRRREVTHSPIAAADGWLVDSVLGQAVNCRSVWPGRAGVAGLQRHLDQPRLKTINLPRPCWCSNSATERDTRPLSMLNMRNSHLGRPFPGRRLGIPS